MLSGGSSNDPFVLPNPASFGLTNVSGSYQVTDGLTQVSRALVGGQNTVLLICYGQSLFGNHDDDSYSVASSLNQQFSVDSGGVYVAANPMLGCSWTVGSTHNACYLTRLGDKLIADGYCARVIMANVSIGTTLMSDWAAGGKFNSRLSVLAARLVAAGLVPANLYRCFILQHQGESQDAVSAATYTASCLSAIATLTGNGFSAAKAFVALASYNGGTTSATVRMGQANAVNGTTIFQGPDIDTIGSSNRYDNLHFNSTGCLGATNLWAPILEAH